MENEPNYKNIKEIIKDVMDNKPNYKEIIKAYHRKEDIVAEMKKNVLFHLKFDLLMKYISWDDKVLDVGCGIGIFATPLSYCAREIYGLDFTKELLDRLESTAKSKNIKNITLVNEDICKTNLPNNMFDLTYSYSTLYYIKEIKDAISEMVRVTKPGGKIIFDHGNKNSIHAYGFCRSMPNFPNFYIREKRIFEIAKVLRCEIKVIRYQSLFSALPFISKYVSIASPLDRILSNLPLFRKFAFRLIFILIKPSLAFTS